MSNYTKFHPFLCADWSPPVRTFCCRGLTLRVIATLRFRSNSNSLILARPVCRNATRVWHRALGVPAC